jgi:ferredoxin
MATIITEECINCGACEPECPNTAIFQGGVEFDLAGAKQPALNAEIFFIVPEKCTECVGFFDYEACAAVCPVDCCVTDPDLPESEEVLIERAKELHPDKEFPGPVPSRFNPTQPPPEPAADNGADSPAAPVALGEAAASGPPVPAPEDVEIPILCRSCDGEYTVAYRFFQPGTVLRCPHCMANFTPTTRMFRAIGERLDQYRAALEAEIDRHNSLVDAEHSRFEISAETLCDGAERDVRNVVMQFTEPRKRSMFG